MCIIQEEMFAEGGMLGTWSLQEPLDADTDDGFKDTLWTDTVSMQPSPWDYTSFQGFNSCRFCTDTILLCMQQALLVIPSSWSNCSVLFYT